MLQSFFNVNVLGFLDRTVMRMVALIPIVNLYGLGAIARRDDASLHLIVLSVPHQR